MSASLTDLHGELPPQEPTEARPGTWTIRPDQALRWATVSQQVVPSGAPRLEASFGTARAVGMVAMVLVAGLLGGVGAWVIVP